jgi:DNA mismatch endonuclease (patch repair protein)
MYIESLRVRYVGEARSRNMRAVRGKDTKPELMVRSAAHRLGLRFRLFRKDLAGRPDMTFPKWRTVLFVNGCFWHQHEKCKRAKLPATNTLFWSAKLQRNVDRDVSNYKLLKALGWRVLVLWECEINWADASRKLNQWFPSAMRT